MIAHDGRDCDEVVGVEGMLKSENKSPGQCCGYGRIHIGYREYKAKVQEKRAANDTTEERSSARRPTRDHVVVIGNGMKHSRNTSREIIARAILPFPSGSSSKKGG